MNNILRENIWEIIVVFEKGEIGCEEALDFIAVYITDDRNREKQDQTTTGPNK